MRVAGWLDDTRASYDTVAVSYAGLLREALAGEPFQRGLLALFAELVRAREIGPVADIGCGPGRITAKVAAWLRAAGFTVEAEMTHRPAPAVEGGFVFAHR